MCGMSTKKDPMVKTSVTMRKSQREWAKQNHINTSGILQDAINQMMKKVKYV